MSQETHAARWIGFRQPVLRVALESGGPALRPHLAGARGGGARPGLGGGRVLDRAVVADRSRRRARHPEVLRVAVPSGREAAHRGAVPLDLREQRARPSRGGARASGSRRSSTCASTARSWSRTSVYRTHEQPLAAARSRGRDGRSGHAGRAEGRSGDRRRDRRPAPLGFPTPSRKLEFFSGTLKAWKWPGAGRAQLHPEPRPLVEPRPREGRDGPACPRSGCRRSSTRARATPSGSTRSPTRTRSGCIPRTRRELGVATGDLLKVATAHRSLRRPRVGHRGGSARRGRVLAPPRTLAPARGRGRRALVHRRSVDLTQPEPGQWRMRQVHGAAAVQERRSRFGARLVGGRGRPPEPHVPGPARPGQRPALLAPEGDACRGPGPTIATATWSWTPNRSFEVYREWLGHRAPGAGPGQPAASALAAAGIQARRVRLPAGRCLRSGQKLSRAGFGRIVFSRVTAERAERGEMGGMTDESPDDPAESPGCARRPRRRRRRRARGGARRRPRAPRCWD